MSGQLIVIGNFHQIPPLLFPCVLVIMPYFLSGPLQPSERQKDWHDTGKVVIWWRREMSYYHTLNLFLQLEGWLQNPATLSSVYVLVHSSPEDKSSFEKDITKGTGEWRGRILQCSPAIEAFRTESISKPTFEEVGFGGTFVPCCKSAAIMRTLGAY